MSRPDIVQDIAGRASEVLDALGIDQRAFNQHVHCPLPGHDDHDPSFRVDNRTERFYCTCTPRGASMIDLVIAKGHASDFVGAARWLRKALLIQAAPRGKQAVRVPINFVTAVGPDPRQVKARLEILRVFSRCDHPPSMHPYLVRKGIPGIGARYEPKLRCLVIPIHDANFLIHGIELIHPDGDKACVEGTRKTGHGLLLGDRDRSPVLGITEGWATGVSVHLAMNGMPVLVTFGCSNLMAAKNFARPDQSVWFFADKDDVGIKAAHAAASAFGHGARVILPSLGDFNEDYLAGIGLSSFAKHRHEFGKLLDGG